MKLATGKVFLLFFLLGITLVVNSQTSTNSPYSGFGFGELTGTNSVQIKSAGNIPSAYRSSQVVNFLNPASYTAFDTTSFIFEGAFDIRYQSLKTTSLKEDGISSSIGYLLFGFPLTKWAKCSFGIVPLSRTGYRITDEDTDPGIGKIGYSFQGSGGINQFYLGSGFQISRSLSIGANVSYIFGTLDKNEKIFFPDSIYMSGTKIEKSYAVGDFLLSYGIQYHKEFNNDFIFTAGAAFNLKTNLDSKETYLARSFIGTFSGVENFTDTVLYRKDESLNIVYPSGFHSGISIRKKGKWLAGIDFSQRKWTEYKLSGISDSLENTYKLAAGGEVTPSNSSVDSYWKRCTYRFGMNYEKSYLNFRDDQLNAFGINFGMSLPIRKTKSSLNFGFEVNNLGTTEKNLIHENNFNFTFGVSIYEWWFIKPKYF